MLITINAVYKYVISFAKIQKNLKKFLLYILISIISVSGCYESLLLVSGIFKKNIIVESIILDDTESDDDSNENDESLKLKFDYNSIKYNQPLEFKNKNIYDIYSETNVVSEFYLSIDFPPELV